MILFGRLLALTSKDSFSKTHKFKKLDSLLFTALFVLILVALGTEILLPVNRFSSKVNIYPIEVCILLTVYETVFLPVDIRNFNDSHVSISVLAYFIHAKLATELLS